jgi:cell wall-associated NlpC family hydrolase
MQDPWCCAFVVAVFEQCGMRDIIPCYAACDQMISVFTKWGRYFSRSVRCVRPGDIIFYDWNGDLSADHVGIVVQNRFGDLSVIEGNKTDSVAYRNISITSSQILGFGVPNYDASDGSSGESRIDSTSEGLDASYIKTLPILQYGKSNVYVKILQVLLNYYEKADLEVDGQYGVLSKKAVADYQMKYKLEVDGIVGTETWTHLLTKR